MGRTNHICLMAIYNDWMNAKVYEAARSLTDEELSVDRKAFFGSILGTLNHLVAGDTIWLKRFAKHPANHLALEPIRQLPAPKASTSYCSQISENFRHIAFGSIR